MCVFQHARSGIESMTYIITIQHDTVDIRLVKFVVQRIRDRTFSGTAQAGKPDHTTLVRIFFFAGLSCQVTFVSLVIINSLLS